MGFHVSIDGNADALLKRLRASPADVFDRPYKGYMLFLAGAEDQKICEWIAEKVMVLDSLTGKDVAFAVFARSFRVKLHTGWSPKPPARLPQHVGELPLQDMAGGSWHVKKLVKSGRCGWVIDGDEIAAVTYAVDEIARGLNLLGKLPCVVVLDAIPSERMNFIHLSEQVCQSFVELLRQSLAKFSVMPGYPQLESSVLEILDFHRAIDKAAAVRPGLERQLQLARESLEHTERISAGVSSIRNNVERRIREARVALYRASLKGFRAAISGAPQGGRAGHYDPISGLDREMITEVLEYAELQHRILWSIWETIASLNRSRGVPEPERSKRLAPIIEKHAPRLLPNTPIPLVDRIQDRDIDALLHILQNTGDSLVNDIMKRIPSVEALCSILEQTEHDRHLHELDEQRKRIKELEDAIEEILLNPDGAVREASQRYTMAVRHHFAADPASLWKAMSQTLREMRLEAFSASAQTTATRLAAGIFSPDFLLKVWQTVKG